MTPEIREAATKAMKADQELEYLLHQRSYELQEQKKSNTDGK